MTIIIKLLRKNKKTITTCIGKLIYFLKNETITSCIKLICFLKKNYNKLHKLIYFLKNRKLKKSLNNCKLINTSIYLNVNLFKHIADTYKLKKNKCFTFLNL